MPVRPRLLHLVFAIAALLSLAGTPGLAQQRVDIRFQPGATSTTINGTIVGRDYIDYVLRARGGQTMVVSLAVTGTNGNGSAYFNILPAGQDFPALFNGSNGGRRAEVVLPSSGAWAIRVYLMGNDRDTRRTVGYSIDVYLSPASGGGSGSGSAAPLPEEDLFVVRLSNPGGALNVRNAPRPSGRLLGQLADGTTVSNAGGCVMSDGQQWCDVRDPRTGLRGWVAARFLALPQPGGSTSATPPSGGSPVVRVTGVAANDVLNVRAGPGTQHRIVGALGNGTSVRRLRCEAVGAARWCEIEMMTDMRERGWVNARFLTDAGGQASQLPSASRMQRVRFSSGTNGTELSDQLMPQASVSYILSARDGQTFYFRLAANGPNMGWRIFNPDGSLLDEGAPSKSYRGQLWQTGDHVVEIVNRGNGAESFNVVFGLQ